MTTKRYLGITLHFIKKESLASITAGVKELGVCVIVTFFKKSVGAADELRKTQEFSGFPQLKAKQSVPTHWNPVYYMLEIFIELSEMAGLVLLQFPKAPPMITATQLLVFKEVIRILKPFEVLTKELSGDAYVASSKVIPLVQCVTNKIVSLQQLTDTGQKLKDIALAEINKRYGAVEHVANLAVSIILYPRFKRMDLNDPEAISEAMRNMYGLMQELSDTDGNIAGETCNKPVEINEDSLWSYHSELVKSTQVSSSGASDDELKQYSKQSVIPIF
ncbi:hypothetical protein PR048_006131 [Dryococelus australis]|uniref:Uncharacterized protein n=1 Tax=Dryococelus australis TaxID=614101 RepID=A0ABQ9IA49_9NEOP|nr:hypothetical protein PR048_006131 [Dryococelus australis]